MNGIFGKYCPDDGGSKTTWRNNPEDSHLCIRNREKVKYYLELTVDNDLWAVLTVGRMKVIKFIKGRELLEKLDLLLSD